MDKGARKTLQFVEALADCYRDEEERTSFNYEKLPLNEEELTDDFTRMLIALHILYKRITGDEKDLIGFTHILNRLALQYILNEQKESKEDE